VIERLALFPLHAVLFPGGRLPLRLFEQRYLGMAKECLRDGLPFGVCLIREGREVGAPATPAEVGCLARIASWDMPQLGLLNIVARGEERFRIVARTLQADGLARADVVRLAPEESDAPVPAQCRACVTLIERLIAEHGEALFEPPFRPDSSAWVSARLAELLPLPLAEKQALLEVSDGSERIERLARVLGA
jgi:Lon protease-like protein